MIINNVYLNISKQLKNTTMKNKSVSVWSLKCKYYTKTFNSLNELIDDVMISGMDPNYMITRDGKSIGERAINLIN